MFDFFYQKEIPQKFDFFEGKIEKKYVNWAYLST